ncbi:MAG: YesL family protein [Caldicoprobacterales bacterium]|jgi:uncharacterized membrane protein YesL|nr:DUF624 domain-containing protein [Clostridiales bacterium]
MFGGFFNRMYYGDPRKPELKKEDVKGSRFKLFTTVLSVRFWQLMQLNLLYSIFWIPAFLLNFAHAVMMQETGQVISIPFFLLMIPCLMLTGPATAAVSYIIRNWARDEHAWVWSDFKDAWKENWKQGLFVMLMNGIFFLLSNIGIYFYGYRFEESGSFLFLYMKYFMFLFILMIAMMNMFIFPMIVTYRLKLKDIIRNAFILTMVKLPFTFLIFLFSAAWVVLSLAFLASLPFFVVGLTFPALIILSYVNWIFDIYINNRIMEQEQEQGDISAEQVKEV